MALPTLASLPVSFTKMLFPHKRRSSPIAIRSSNVPRQTQCRASYNVSDNSKNILRRSANYQPSIWTYDYIQSLSSEYKEEMFGEQVRILREEVRMMLCEVEKNEVDQLELIDVLQRLGVAYHYNNEIRNILDNIYNMDTSMRKKNLHATALKFRLLRQHGYNISSDVFVCFQDETGNFKKCQSVDAEGMLSLYEASFLSFEDETILDEAREFASEFLREYLNQNRGDHISLLISHALELPLHWMIPRWEAWWFINVYESKPNMNPTLLQFAKLDFNIVQAIYQEELKDTSSWWKSIGLVEKLSFGRDRLVENFVWAVGTNFRPDHEYFRKTLTKINSMITTIDDIYDVYGTLEELKLFTEAIARWDLNAMDSLPYYMKICFHALYNFVNEMAFEILKRNGNYVTPYLKKVWTDLCKSYFVEAKWYHAGYVPSLEEYMENAWISISIHIMLTHAYFMIPYSFKKEDLDYLEEYSDIIRFSAMISRLANDLGTYKRENETGDTKSIQCYMNESGASEIEACEYLKSMMCTTWKKMNQEAHNSPLSQSFIDTTMNMARISLWVYQHGDGYTIQYPKITSRILSLIIQPIPIICIEK